jgi:anhydro-N-acetylmuramic acid kinase
MRTWNVIGLMSGTSLDGLDIAFCRFSFSDGRWSYVIEKAETLAYSPEWKKRLQDAFSAPAPGLARFHMDYGHFLGNAVNEFIRRHNIDPQFVSSHGHTIFHDPGNGYTFQAGSGAAIAAECRLPVVCDFRAMDVALGGQGAPLVPVGDKLLFNDHDACLNLGGFANISYDHNDERIAYDICPVNIVANAIAAETGKEYDSSGDEGRKGKISEALLGELNSLSYYHLPAHSPKSLGKEWIDNVLMPAMRKHSLSPADKLATLYEHIAIQVGRAAAGGEMLVTGGGAYNTYLLERIKQHTPAEILIPPGNIVEFKEALIFAFLGVLRMEERANCLRDVTGAASDSIGGCVYLHK